MLRQLLSEREQLCSTYCSEKATASVREARLTLGSVESRLLSGWRKNHICFAARLAVACLILGVWSLLVPESVAQSEYAAWCDDEIDPYCEPYFAGRSLFLENDVIFAELLGLNQDRSYTMGFVYQSAGRWVNEMKALAWPLDLLNWLTRFRRVHGLARPRGVITVPGERRTPVQLHVFQLGSSAFTPDSLQLAEAILDDRPFASILFMGVRRQTLVRKKVAVSSEYKIGVLGLRISETGQTWIHEILRGEDCGRLDPTCGPVDPQGWPNQISDGGELTGKYAVGMQRRFWEKREEGLTGDLQGSVEGEVGYYTDATVRLAGRAGRVRSAWWHFRPNPISEVVNLSAFASQPEAKTPRLSEMYVWGGLGLRVVGYNALLQGQFRDNVHELEASEISRIVGEFQLGLAVQLKHHGVSLAFAGRTSEHQLNQARQHFWGGIYYTYNRFLERLR